MWRKTDRTPRRRPVPGILCLALAVYFLAPAVTGTLHIGMLWPAALLLLAASVCFWPRWPQRLPRRLRGIAAGIIAMGLSAAAVILVLMILADAHRPAAAEAPETVIVLGCGLRPDGSPSLMLRHRINAACDYLTAHPEAVCVASGCQAGDECISEARCIQNTLLSLGIAPERIYLEERSRSTRENLDFSADVIRENGLNTRVALSTDNFHQYRSQFFARRAGLEPLSIGNPSYPLLGPGYWAREIPAILAAWLRGY